jgi:phage protein D
MPELGVTPGVINADAQIEIDGERNPNISAGLLSLLVEETTESLYRCEACFGNWGNTEDGPSFLYLDREILDFGKSLTVTLGSGDGSRQVFMGYISALEAQFTQDSPPTIVVLAEDRAQDLRGTRRTRVFEDMSDAQVFEKIAQEHNLETEIDIQGPTHTLLAQVNQSDLAFIRERARRVGAEIWLDDRTLHVKTRTGRTSVGADLTLIRGRGLLEFTATVSL